ncbi:MAG: hypothetical protein BV457_06745 [Thermoplasmata archaeon M9B1D]|nr:MAG: hypothetical protein BV457_06745 [Thermoplasmata archaeon M9B1D]
MQDNKIFRKILIFGIMASLILSVMVPIINAGNFQTTNITGNEVIENELLSTHKVLAEEGTATWCGYCPVASAQLYQCYTMGLDFSIVTLVADMNSYASSRCSELGLTGYPTVFFDGGYSKVVGQQSSYTVYYNTIIACGNRAVADISLNLHAFWLGSGQIGVNIDVTNNGGSTYNGHLHVYVTEET